MQLKCWRWWQAARLKCVTTWALLLFIVHLDLCSYSISIDWWFAWPCCRGLWAMLKAALSCFHVHADLFSVEHTSNEMHIRRHTQKTHTEPPPTIPPSFPPSLSQMLTQVEVKLTQTNARTHTTHSLSLSRLPNGSGLGVTLYPRHPLHHISCLIQFLLLIVSVFRRGCQSQHNTWKQYFEVEFICPS